MEINERGSLSSVFIISPALVVSYRSLLIWRQINSVGEKFCVARTHRLRPKLPLQIARSHFTFLLRITFPTPERKVFAHTGAREEKNTHFSPIARLIQDTFSDSLVSHCSFSSFLCFLSFFFTFYFSRCCCCCCCACCFNLFPLCLSLTIMD
jgi:hypothetical protein